MNGGDDVSAIDHLRMAADRFIHVSAEVFVQELIKRGATLSPNEQYYALQSYKAGFADGMRAMIQARK